DLASALRQISAWGAEAIVVHLGAQGAGWYQAGELTIEPPAPVASPTHITGTGDVLSVCMMLLHHREDMDVPRRLRSANATVAQFMEGRLELIPPLAG